MACRRWCASARACPVARPGGAAVWLRSRVCRRACLRCRCCGTETTASGQQRLDPEATPAGADRAPAQRATRAMRRIPTMPRVPRPSARAPATRDTETRGALAGCANPAGVEIAPARLRSEQTLQRVARADQIRSALERDVRAGAPSSAKTALPSSDRRRVAGPRRCAVSATRRSGPRAACKGPSDCARTRRTSGRGPPAAGIGSGESRARRTSIARGQITGRFAAARASSQGPCGAGVGAECGRAVLRFACAMELTETEWAGS